MSTEAETIERLTRELEAANLAQSAVQSDLAKVSEALIAEQKTSSELRDEVEVLKKELTTAHLAILCWEKGYKLAFDTEPPKLDEDKVPDSLRQEVSKKVSARISLVHSGVQLPDSVLLDDGIGGTVLQCPNCWAFYKFGDPCMCQG
jgi:hypothetical protein